MKSFFAIYLLCTIASSYGALPSWNEQDRKALESGQLIPGAGLLAAEVDLDDGVVTPKETEPDPIRPLIIEPTPIPTEFEYVPLEDDDRQLISERLVTRYFSAPIDEGIVDPQVLLTSKESLDVKYALERYSEESPVSIYFYLFDKKQMVPKSNSAEVTFNRFYFSEPSAVVVYYFIEEPERCQVYFGGKDANLIATNKIRALISGMKMGAKKRSNRISQLDEFIRQLSLHMFWIEKAMIEDIYTPLLAQQEPTTKSSAPRDKMQETMIMRISQFSKIWWKVLLAALGLILLLLVSVYWVSSRRFLFPKLAVKPRLDLPNGGSSGGILSYKEQNQPPSSQRGQFDKPF